MLDTTSGDAQVEWIDVNTGEVICCTFRPNFKNLARIGSPAEIVDVFGKLFCADGQRFQRVPDSLFVIVEQSLMKEALSAAHQVLFACHDEQDVDALVSLIGGYAPSYKRDRLVYQVGKMPIKDIITLARSLMRHGMIGETERGGGGEYASEWNPAEFADMVATILKVSQDEAEQMTMTRFQRRFDQLYPDAKKNRESRISREEYEQLKAAIAAKRAK